MSATEQKTPKVVNPTFLATLGQEQWIKDNAIKLTQLFPAEWTAIREINGLKIGFNLKLLGIDWKTNEEFSRVMVLLDKIGISQVQNMSHIRANPNFVFNNQVALK